MGSSSVDKRQDQCPQHGEFTSFNLPAGWSICVECDYANEAASDAKDRQQWRDDLVRREWDAKLGRAAIPERFVDRTLANYESHCEGAGKALRLCQDYAAKFGKVRKLGTSLIFCGERGTGKTHLAIGIAHAIIADGYLPVFTSVMRAVRSVKETYGRKDKTEADAIKDLITPDLLILDEVGVQFGSAAEELILFEIINGRYEALKPTIVISNLAKPDIEKYLGPRSFDRMRENGGRMVIFEWESYRSRRPEDE